MSDSLRSLSDSALLSRTCDLVAREREVTLNLLLHLNEIERRKLHLSHGYSSMFNYCTAGLGYSEPAAFRRIRTARCVARFSEIYALLHANEVNLSTIARVSRVLTIDNKDTLLARIRGRSRREVEAIVSEYEPQTVRADIVRPVAVRAPSALGALELSCRTEADSDSGPGLNAVNAATAAACTSSVAQTPCEKSDYLRREGNSHPTSSTEQRVQYHFTARDTFHRKLEKIRTLAWHRLPANASLAQVFELVMDEFIEKHDPRAREERRKKRTLAKSQPKQMSPDRRSKEYGSRRIATAVKDNVFVRDNGQCAFVGTDGRRCDETRNLHIDHVTPKGRNGSNEVNNLRLLCARHNQLEAERVFGSNFMTQHRRL